MQCPDSTCLLSLSLNYNIYENNHVCCCIAQGAKVSTATVAIACVFATVNAPLAKK
jgi:hypothetical protein